MFEKTALGIDISDKTISLAVLKRSKKGVELVKAASGPVPAGAIEDGNIKDAAKLSRAIKELKSRVNIRTHQAAASLIAKPVVVQMLEVPEPTPTNVGQFVQDEVKHYAVLAGEKTVLDFCRTISGPRLSNSRLFLVASNGRRVTGIANMCRQAGFHLGAIEPSLVAYTRAVYSKKIAGRFDCNVLMAILQGGVLSLCVFRNGIMDFVRTEDISKEEAEGNGLCQRLYEEINAIIKFYDIEVPDSSGDWEITVVADCEQSPEALEESLKAKVACTELQVRTPENASYDTLVGQDGVSKDASPVAIGLALKFLDTKVSNIGVNLLTQESLEIETVRKDILITANIVAVVLVLMILATGTLTLMVKRVKENVASVKQTSLSRDTTALLRRQEALDRQIKELSDRPMKLSSILSLRKDAEWSSILKDIKNGTPTTMRITELSSKDNSKMSMRGLALSYEAIRLFVDILNESEHIDLASLTETEKESEGYGLIRYAIECSLTDRGG